MDYNINRDSLLTICCLLLSLILWVRHVKSTLGLSPAVCELRVYIRLTALCCVSNSQLSWQHLSCPPSRHAPLWLWTAAFLCASSRLCAQLFVCVSYVPACKVVGRGKKKKKNRQMSCICSDGCLLLWWAQHWEGSAFTNLDRGKWPGNRKAIHPNLCLSLKMRKNVNEWLSSPPSNYNRRTI